MNLLSDKIQLFASPLELKTDHITARTNTPKTMDNETKESTWIIGATTIFTPINVKITAKPYFNFENM